MAERRIADDELFVHFLTFSCDHRRRLRAHDQPKRMVLGVLRERLARQEATCLGFVIMPDHVHALVWFPRTVPPAGSSTSGNGSRAITFGRGIGTRTPRIFGTSGWGIDFGSRNI